MAEIPGKPPNESELASPAEGALSFDKDNVRGEVYPFQQRFVKLTEKSYLGEMWGWSVSYY